MHFSLYQLAHELNKNYIQFNIKYTRETKNSLGKEIKMEYEVIFSSPEKNSIRDEDGQIAMLNGYSNEEYADRFKFNNKPKTLHNIEGPKKGKITTINNSIVIEIPNEQYQDQFVFSGVLNSLKTLYKKERVTGGQAELLKKACNKLSQQHGLFFVKLNENQYKKSNVYDDLLNNFTIDLNLRHKMDGFHYQVNEAEMFLMGEYLSFLKEHDIDWFELVLHKVVAHYAHMEKFILLDFVILFKRTWIEIADQLLEKSNEDSLTTKEFLAYARMASLGSIKNFINPILKGGHDE